MNRSSTAPSFRDPHGQVVAVDGRIFRLVNREGLESFESCSNTKGYQKLVNDGRLINTERLDGSSDALLPPPLVSQLNPENIAAVLEHDAVPFPSYPAEWPPEMLHAAAELTLDIQLAQMDEGIGL